MLRPAHITVILVALVMLVHVPDLYGQERLGETEVIELSDWVKPHSQLGITSYRNGEFFMRSKKADGSYFYVLVAPEDYTSELRTTEVTLRNLNGARSKLGYGLVFHSAPTPLMQDYAFLIDTVRKRYRVVRHSPDDEIRVIQWKASSYINPGRRANTLMVTDRGTTTDLYINGHLVDSVDNTFAYKSGQPGLYTDRTKIGFKNLTVSR